MIALNISHGILVIVRHYGSEKFVPSVIFIQTSILGQEDFQLKKILGVKK